MKTTKYTKKELSTILEKSRVRNPEMMNCEFRTIVVRGRFILEETRVKEGKKKVRTETGFGNMKFSSFKYIGSLN